jgi:hypothetical protein
MHVHVPQAGDQELPATGKDVRVGRHACGCRRPDVDDMAAVDDDGLIGSACAGLHVDHRHVGDSDWLLRGDCHRAEHGEGSER